MLRGFLINGAALSSSSKDKGENNARLCHKRAHIIERIAVKVISLSFHLSAKVIGFALYYYTT